MNQPSQGDRLDRESRSIQFQSNEIKGAGYANEIKGSGYTKGDTHYYHVEGDVICLPLPNSKAVRVKDTIPESREIISVDELVSQVRSRFHDDIQFLYGTMPLWGVDRWVSLGELFVDVNILEELSSSSRSELSNLWQDFCKNPSHRSLDRIGLGKARQRVSGLEVLEKNTNLMVVGKPGSGKTTYLQRIVTECNGGNLQTHRIPILIKLRDFVSDGREIDYSLERYFQQYWQRSEVETRLVLSQGRVLVLLDGLDEVTGEEGKTIAKQIKRFIRTYPKVQTIITCRTQSFTGVSDWKSLRFSFVEIADFNQAQVRLFAEHWFKTIMEDELTGLIKTREFLGELLKEDNKPIRELAITPILLSLTCAVFHQTETFYSKRSKLYEEALELLLEQWDKSREIERDEIYRNLLVEKRLELLSYLAIKKFEQEQYVLFEQEEIEKYIAEFLGIGQRESQKVLKAIESQHGLLIERSRKIWSFSHLTLQEYLVAKQLVQFQEEQTFTKHISDTRWREVYILALGLSNKSDELIGLIATQARSYIQSPKLIALMKWAKHITDGSTKDFQPTAKCSVAIVLAFARERSLALNHSLALNLVRSLDINLADIVDFPRCLVDINLDIERECVCIEKLHKTAIFQNVDFTNLINILKKIKSQVPRNIEPIEIRRKFTNLIRQSLYDILYLDSTYFNLSKKEIEAMGQYLYIIELLVSCKQINSNISVNYWNSIEEHFFNFGVVKIQKIS